MAVPKYNKYNINKQHELNVIHIVITITNRVVKLAILKHKLTVFYNLTYQRSIILNFVILTYN